MYGIIGGSGLSQLPNLEGISTHVVPTPYGEPSGPLVCGQIHSTSIVFLARHGHGHTIAPHQINYRANLWALKEQGVSEVISVASVGGIRPDLAPGYLLIPDQIIDYTWGRESTFFEGGKPVVHIDFTDPYTAALRAKILAAAKEGGEKVFDGGVYATTQGPRLESAAEVTRLARDGADVVGMTGMPEAALAREIGLHYATITIVVNHAAGRGNSRAGIRMDDIDVVLKEGMGRVLRLIELVVCA